MANILQPSSFPVHGIHGNPFHGDVHDKEIHLTTDDEGNSGVLLINFRTEDAIEIVDWCNKTLGEYNVELMERKFWVRFNRFIYFSHEKYRMMFLLRWK